MKFKRWIKGLGILLAVTAVASGVAVFLINRPADAHRDTFNPNFIISDDMFFTSGTMTVAEIQDFLNRQGANCTGDFCLRTLRLDVPDRPADEFCPRPFVGGNLSAAEILYRTSEACNVNVQVLLVVMQKERSLVAHRNPTATDLRMAMGYGCPDFLPCNGEFANFASQIYFGSRQFQLYRLSPGWQWRRNQIGVPSTWSHSPRAGCGSQTITIANQATLGLYIYTPYVPNANAIAGVSHAVDPCADGNGQVLFWVIFNNWFGSPLSNEGTIAIQARENAVGLSALGARSGSITCTAGSSECSQSYQNGVILWKRWLGAWEIINEHHQVFLSSGGLETLGHPIWHPVEGEGWVGQVQPFERGAIVVDGTERYTMVWPLSGLVRLHDGHFTNILPNGSVGTGGTVELRDTNGVLRGHLVATVTGDVNGDGRVDLADLLLVGRHLAGIQPLEGVYYNAANVAGEPSLQLTSLLRLGRHLSGIEEIR
ncbi:dockerin type I repeat-containing protein [Candidatus Saccharibacteria bacterium]|nr:dockerin type I repeat-containing protein [Candidatus Saccharibacteria bacterium]